MKRNLLLLALAFPCFLLSQNSQFQKTLITGNVMNSKGEPLERIGIWIKGSERGTATDSEGYFELEVAENEIVAFSSIGYGTETRMGRDLVENNFIQMTEKTYELYEVTVTFTNPYRSKPTCCCVSFREDSSSINLHLSHIPPKFNYYPNPVKDRIYIETEGMAGEVKLFSIQGVELRKKIINGSLTELKLEDLSPGTYVLSHQYQEKLEPIGIIVK